MHQIPSFSRVLLGLVILGGGGWAFLRHTAAALERQRADLVVQARRHAETESRLAGEIAREENARLVSAAETETQLTAIRQAIQDIARLPVVPLERPLSTTPLPPPPRGPRDNVMFAELLPDPEYARLCTSALRQDADERYGAILFRLQREPAKLAALTQLLIERRLVAIEAEHLAFQHGLASPQQPEAASHASDQLESEIRRLAGDDLYEQLR